MRRLSFYYDTALHFSGPVGAHSFLLRCVPPDRPEQRIEEFHLELHPAARGGRYGTDAFGNRTYTGRLPGAHTCFRYTVKGMALRDDSRKQPEDVLPCFKYPSPLTQPTGEMKDFLQGLGLGGTALEKGEALAKAVHRHFTYTPGVTSVRTTAGEAFHDACGVCQDYAHTFLALARLAGIPARYVSGLPHGEGETHAWVEVWEEGLWYGLDPTRDCPVDEGYLKLCVGRDFMDCPVEAGIFTGTAQQAQHVYMKVEAEQQ